MLSLSISWKLGSVIMKVKCILCDDIHELLDNSLEAKRLRNHLDKIYMCPDCSQRITKKLESHSIERRTQPFKKKQTEFI